MKPEEREEISKQIREEVDRDREFIKEVAGSAFKILGIGVGVIALVVGFVGIKTTGDLKRAAEDKAEATIKEHIGRATQNIYEREIERLKDDAFVDAMIARLAVASMSERGTRFWVFTESEYEELLKIMEKPDCSSKSYRHAAGILARLDHHRNPARDGAILHKLLQKGGSKTYWPDDTDFRLKSTIELLAQMKYAIAVEDVRAIAARPELPFARRAAIAYLGNIRDTPSVQNLATMLSVESDQRTKDALLEAIAKTNPEAPAVTNWLQGLDRVDVERMAKALEFAVGAYSSKHTNIALRIFRRFVDDGYSIREDAVFRSTWGDFRNLEIVHPKSDPLAYERQRFDYYVLFGSPGTEIIESMMTEAASAGDVVRLERIMRAFSGDSRYGRPYLTTIMLLLRPPTALTTVSGEAVTTSDQMPEILLQVSSTTNQVHIRWCDTLGRLRDEPLKEILNPKRVWVTYSLRRRPVMENWDDLLFR